MAYDAAFFTDNFLSKTFRSANGEMLPYRFYAPPGALPEKAPLVVHMHGHGGEGTDNLRHITGTVDKQTTRRRASMVCVQPDNQARFPCFVIAPQAREGGWVTFTEEITESVAMVLELVRHLLETLPIDARRCYVMGHSMGAHGTWDLLSRAPELFAAGVPIGGWGRVEGARCLVDMPIWAFAVADDSVIKAQYSRNMIAAIEAVGGSPRYTEYSEGDHLGLLRAYDEPELLSWLFAQRREK